MVSKSGILVENHSFSIDFNKEVIGDEILGMCPGRAPCGYWQ
jgi:hypothetical protein